MKPSLNFATVRRVGLTAVLLSIASTQAFAAAKTALPPTVVSTAATNFLPRWTELAGASVQSYVPIYKPRTNTILFYEAKLVNVRTGELKGSLILDLTGKVVQFNSSGPSFADRLAQQNAGEFKLVRFGPRYMTAEDSRGTKVAEVGTPPTLPVRASGTGMVERPSVRFNSIRMGANQRPQFDTREIRRYSSPAEMYSDYVLNYDAYFANRTKTATPPDLFGGTLGLMDQDPPPDGGGGGGGTGSGSAPVGDFTAIGHDKAFSINQLAPEDPLNTVGYYTGCGPAAWMNMFLWHDVNGWTPGLMTPQHSEDFYHAPFRVATPWEAMHMIGLNETLGTFENIFNDLGATFASDMHRGHDVYARHKLGYNVDVLEVDSWFTNEPELLAIKGIRDYAKPVIIGYWADVHYDIAYRWKRENDKNYFRIDFKASDDAPDHSWVEGSDIFYTALPLEIRSVGNNFGENASLETSLDGWAWKLNGSGAAYHMKGRNDAATGLGYMRLASTGAGVKKVWSVLDVPSAGVLGHKVSIKLRGSGVTATVKIRQGTANKAAEPTTQIHQSKNVSLYGIGWQKVEFDLPSYGWFTIEVSYETSTNTPTHVDIDDGIVTTQWHDQQPGTWMGLPCVKGKPGLDGGCEFP